MEEEDAEAIDLEDRPEESHEKTADSGSDKSEKTDKDIADSDSDDRAGTIVGKSEPLSTVL